MYKIIIEGKPLGKERPRVTKWGTFTPLQTKSNQAFIQMMFSVQNPNAKVLTGALKVTIVGYFPIPKSASKKKREAMLSGEIRHTSKIDADNLAKQILDSLNKLAIYDDSLVCELHVYKYYSDKPRTEVTIEEI